jgi:hypothetical protein
MDLPEKNTKNDSKIIFLPCDPSEIFTKHRAKYLNFFDVIYISSALAHRVKDAIGLLRISDDRLSSTSRVVVESATFIIDLNKQQKELFNEKIDEMALDSGLKKVKLDRRSEFLVYK